MALIITNFGIEPEEFVAGAKDGTVTWTTDIYEAIQFSCRSDLDKFCDAFPAAFPGCIPCEKLRPGVDALAIELVEAHQ